jgi:prolyl 4-hydroxylase
LHRLPELGSEKLGRGAKAAIFFHRRGSYHAAMQRPGESSAEHLLARKGMQRVPSPKLELFILRDFLSADHCAALIDRIEAQRRPSTIADANGDDAFRTSETCDLDHADPAVAELGELLAAVSGIDPAHGEPLQGQRYEIGQQFKAHTDYFEPGGADFSRYCSVAGQRTWTFMIYLNDVAAGGATRFKEIDKIVQPERGKLLAWNNRRPDGSVNYATLHHGMKVRQGLKYVITRWYRERPWG